MSGFTPGPWRIEPDATFIGGSCVGADNGDIGVMVEWPLNREPEQWANANLIAAAPDLYEALQDALTDGGVIGWEDRAQAALSKARGQS